MLVARPVASLLSEVLESAAARSDLDREDVEPHRSLLLLVTGATDAQRAELLGMAHLGLRVTLGGARRPDALLISGCAADLARARARATGAVAEALAAVERLGTPLPALEVGGRRFEWGRGPCLMGVVNTTPDSFYDGGRFLEPARAIAHGEQLVRAGAHWLDVGGESTRPGAETVDEEAELARVLPVVAGLHALLPETLISIDTSKVQVARKAISAGAAMINDVAGLRDPEMLELAAETGVAVCIMHMKGVPRTMQRQPTYNDVVAEVLEALGAGTARAVAAGILRHRIVVDPGFGFGKSLGHNLFLLRHLNDLRLLGSPIVAGTSRKSMLGLVTGGKPPSERLAASLASVAIIVASRGADVLRVHDVAETRDAVALSTAVGEAREGGLAFETRTQRSSSAP
jgi:dihydropteroate synthase